MAREVRHFAVTVPAGTTQAAPLVQDTPVSVRILRRVEWVFPPGCGGLVGFYFSMGGVQVIPSLPLAWIVEEGTSGGLDVDGQPDSGAWQVTAYNLGANPHTLQVRYHVDLHESPDREPLLLDGLALSHFTTQLGD